MRTVQADGYEKEMWPSGKVNVFRAAAAGFADGADTATGGAVLAVGATGAALADGAGVAAGAAVTVGADAVVAPAVERGAAAAGSVPGCDAHPARTRLSAMPAIVTCE
ncbi:hypothetical protein [Arthrobacter sp. 9MFCol3.1]|uniref:hypothetical protein n=1 Tax=Arthrobacter sp. 9MFCol3.1 TaxID=1150398 RepID=UPI00047C1EB3|nr:hypothetical protein [Arthrobacter sp. 9MFCol3.1]